MCVTENGLAFSCKMLNDDIYSWGYNIHQQLGGKGPKYVYKPKKIFNWPKDIIDIKCSHHTLVLTANQEVYSYGLNNYGQ